MDLSAALASHSKVLAKDLLSSAASHVQNAAHTGANGAGNSNYWIVGVILALFASAMSNLGTNLQKLAHIKNGRKEHKRRWRESKTWIVGVALLTSASLVDLIALAFAPQSLVAPLGLTTLISNVFLSSYLLKEKVGLRDVTGVVFLICGMAMIISYGPKSDAEIINRRYQDLFALYTRIGFIIYFSVIVAFIVSCLYFTRRFDQIRDSFGHASKEYMEVVNAHRGMCAALAGTMASQNVLFGRASAELCSELFTHGEYGFFGDLWTYVTITMLCITTLVGTFWLNQALVRFEASFVVPVFSTFWVSGATVGGLVFFREATLLTGDAAVWFVIGMMVAVLGLAVFASKPVKAHRLDKDGRPVMYQTPMSRASHMKVVNGNRMSEEPLSYSSSMAEDRAAAELLTEEMTVARATARAKAMGAYQLVESAFITDQSGTLLYSGRLDMITTPDGRLSLLGTGSPNLGFKLDDGGSHYGGHGHGSHRRGGSGRVQVRRHRGIDEEVETDNEDVKYSRLDQDEDDVDQVQGGNDNEADDEAEDSISVRRTPLVITAQAKEQLLLSAKMEVMRSMSKARMRMDDMDDLALSLSDSSTDEMMTNYSSPPKRDRSRRKYRGSKTPLLGGQLRLATYQATSCASSAPATAIVPSSVPISAMTVSGASKVVASSPLYHFANDDMDPHTDV